MKLIMPPFQLSDCDLAAFGFSVGVTECEGGRLHSVALMSLLQKSTGAESKPGTSARKRSAL